MTENQILMSDQDFEDFLTIILSREKGKENKNKGFDELVTKIVNQVKSNLVINENGYYVTTKGMPLTVNQLSFLIFLSMSREDLEKSRNALYMLLLGKSIDDLEKN